MDQIKYEKRIDRLRDVASVLMVTQRAVTRAIKELDAFFYETHTRREDSDGRTIEDIQPDNEQPWGTD